MAKDLVVLTGVTGFVGFRTLITALEAGYQVRATLRRKDQIDYIKSQPLLKPYLDDVEFAIVPDLAANNAYAGVLDGAKYVLHVASPVIKDQDADVDIEAFVVTPAIAATINMLQAASATPSIKRVVITSSIVAIVPFEAMVAKESDKVFNDESRVINPTFSNIWEAYSAGKAMALNKTLEYMEKEKPHFDVINIMPGPIIGANPLTTNPADHTQPMNGSVMAILLGTKGIGSFPASGVHVNDVASLHVWSLDPKIAGNQSFVASPGGMEGVQWSDANKYAKEFFPEAVANGTYPLNGDQPTQKLLLDSSRTEKVFNFKFILFSEQVKSVGQQYLDLLAVKA